MSTIINATTTNGVVIQPDNSGSLELQTNSGTTALTIDTSQRAAFVAGTAALPAITTTGDTNTGMFFPAADTIAFAEGGTEAMRLDSSGNVGIGTSGPPTKLSLNGPMYVPASNFKSVLDINSTNSQAAGNGAGITLGGVYTGTTQTAFAQIAGIKENSTDENYAGALAMYYRPNGNTLAEGMRIDSSGNVLIGATSFSGGVPNDSAIVIRQDGFMVTRVSGNGNYAAEFQNVSGTGVGNITVNSGSTQYITSSDYRLKENVVPMTGALDVISQLKPVTYKWKKDGSDGQGFIAHELAEVVPDCVVGEKDAVETYTDEDGIEQTRIKPQGIDTSFLVATLTAAIQEQQQIITDLKATVDLQSVTINDLKARVETLEAK